MNFFIVTALTMLAFASNSVLNRMALDGGHIDPSSFAAVRIVAGVVALVVILAIRHEKVAVMGKAAHIGCFVTGCLYDRVFIGLRQFRCRFGGADIVWRRASDVVHLWSDPWHCANKT